MGSLHSIANQSRAATIGLVARMILSFVLLLAAGTALAQPEIPDKKPVPDCDFAAHGIAFESICVIHDNGEIECMSIQDAVRKLDAREWGELTTCESMRAAFDSLNREDGLDLTKNTVFFDGEGRFFSHHLANLGHPSVVDAGAMRHQSLASFEEKHGHQIGSPGFEAWARQIGEAACARQNDNCRGGNVGAVAQSSDSWWDSVKSVVDEIIEYLFGEEEEEGKSSIDEEPQIEDTTPIEPLPPDGEKPPEKEPEIKPLPPDTGDWDEDEDKGEGEGEGEGEDDGKKKESKVPGDCTDLNCAPTCEELKAACARFKEYCDENGWEPYECVSYLRKQEGCPDITLIYPTDDGDLVCGKWSNEDELAKIREEMCKRFERLGGKCVSHGAGPDLTFEHGPCHNPIGMPAPGVCEGGETWPPGLDGDIPPPPKVQIIVQPGDELGKIARRFYGKVEWWKLIHDSNKNTLGSNPNLIKPGQLLIIPGPEHHESPPE